MYNMEITIGSYKCRLEICILIFVVFWVMFGHVMCSCCTMSMQEGFKRIAEGMTKKGKKHGFANEVEEEDKVEEGFLGLTKKGKKGKEGFVSSNNKAYGPEFGSSKSPGYIMNPDTWAMPTLSYSKGTTPSAGAESILNRNNPPLNEGQMDMFANTPFKPECCPSAFSTSTGCACMDMKQYNFLQNRGNNNVPYDIY